MTPEQKRAHLTVMGLRLRKFVNQSTTLYGWRIYRPAPDGSYPTACMTTMEGAWRMGKLSTAPNIYTDHEFSELPDELLDRLDLSLIEQFLSTTD